MGVGGPKTVPCCQGIFREGSRYEETPEALACCKIHVQEVQDGTMTSNSKFAMPNSCAGWHNDLQLKACDAKFLVASVLLACNSCYLRLSFKGVAVMKALRALHVTSQCRMKR